MKTLQILRHPSTKAVVLTFSPVVNRNSPGKEPGRKFKQLKEKGFVYIGSVRGFNLVGARSF